MSQYHTQYDDPRSPSRPHRPPPSFDEHGYQVAPPHSSSSIYDDPEEQQAIRELDGFVEDSERGYAIEEDEGQSTSPRSRPPSRARTSLATPSYSEQASLTHALSERTVLDFEYATTALSSPSPSSASAFPPFSQRATSTYTSSSSLHSRHSMLPEQNLPPPQPDFHRSQPRSGTNSSASSARFASMLALSHNGNARYAAEAPVLRPNPIRPMPMPSSARSTANTSNQQFRSQFRPPASSSSQPPSLVQFSQSRQASSAQVSRREDDGSWHAQIGVNRKNEEITANRIVELDDANQDEDEYWADDTYDRAVDEIASRGQQGTHVTFSLESFNSLQLNLVVPKQPFLIR